MVYLLNEYSKIEINGTSVSYYEKAGERWIQLGPSESWASVDEILWYYGIK